MDRYREYFNGDGEKGLRGSLIKETLITLLAISSRRDTGTLTLIRCLETASIMAPEETKVVLSIAEVSSPGGGTKITLTSSSSMAMPIC